MMMKKYIVLTLLLIVALGAWAETYDPKVLTSPPTEGPWTFDAIRTHYKFNNDTPVSFNGANRDCWGRYTGWDSRISGHEWHERVNQWQDGDGLGYTICTSACYKDILGILSTYYHSELVPSYTRYRLKWTYTLKSKVDDDSRQCIALYQHESLEDIKALVVNYNSKYERETEEGSAHALCHLVYSKEDSKTETGKNTFVFELDNRAGATEQTKQKALMAVYTVEITNSSWGDDSKFSIHQWTSFKSYDLVREAYYYKYVTFKANGGVGTMSGQEIENSGKLNTARFYRSGYIFQGWATTPNGAVEYADGAEITATEADKGPVTLYAVWKADPANVVAMINTIGEVVYTAECKARIDAARAVYNKLSAEDKAQVTNYSVLEAAENTYAAVKDVMTKINNIGSVSYPGSETAITTAQTAYDALTAEQKAIVINVGVLRTAQDQYAVLGVANQISAIGDVSYPESGTAIAAARTAYDALSAGQKTQVANYGTLTAAETAYQQAKEDAGNTTINFVDKDDATLRNQKRTLNYPAAPEVTDYVFQYWQAMEGSLSGGVLLVKAVYAPSSITLNESVDNSSTITALDGCTLNVTLTRTLQTGGWNTFAVPFGIANPASVFGAGVKVKELTAASVSDNTLTLTFSDAASIEAGKPYLVKVESAVANPTFNGVTISNSTTPTEITSVVSFVPVINPTAMTANDKTKLFVTGGNKLAYPSANGNINGFRAYFKLLDANARSFVLDLGDGETTGLNLTPTLSQGERVWYTLDGRKLQSTPTAKGVYIVNGKKTIIK